MKSNVSINSLLSSTLAILAASSLSSSAATILSLNFVENGNGNSAYTGGGVLDATSRTWDTLTGGSANGGGGFSTNAVIGGITANVQDYGDFSSQTNPTINLFDGYAYSGTSNGGAESIVLSGLSSSQTYSLAVYSAWGWGAYTNSFTVTDQNGISSLKSATGTDTSTFIEGVNYVVFSNLVPDAGGNITLNLAGGATDTTQWFVSGLELVTVPEPHSAALAALGIGLALVRRRRC